MKETQGLKVDLGIVGFQSKRNEINLSRMT